MTGLSAGIESGPLQPAMPHSTDTVWPDAVWVGEIDQARMLAAEPVHLADAAGFTRARLLVRRDGAPLGFVEVAVTDSVLDGRALLAAAKAAELDAGPDGNVGDPRPGSDERVSTAAHPPISVVICTRDRPELLRQVLGSLADTDYPDWELIVVDNNPSSELTRPVVDEFGWPNLRIVDAHVPGLARARNVGIKAARFDIIAFTDDDVLVDRQWLRGIAEGFGMNDLTVGCVTGIVPSGEINSLSQSYFDRRVTWARNCRSERYSMASPPLDERMFPFRVGAYGTGANFAIRRELLADIGGFDEAFGAGSPTGGAEDIDIFVRVLLAGYDLVYQPRALIWHRHRSELDSLKRQSHDYGKGLGAWLTKLMLNPRTAVMVLRRAIPGLVHLRSINEMELAPSEKEILSSLGTAERRGMLAGPLAFLRARRSGGRARPLGGWTPELS